MGWSTGRRARLPKDWHKRRAIAKREAGGQCQWIEDSTRCVSVGTDCDHIDRHGSDELSNLQLLCSYHHNIKTQREALESRLPSKRQAARHPGLI